jgi:hypothetical protein
MKSPRLSGIEVEPDPYEGHFVDDNASAAELGPVSALPSLPAAGTVPVEGGVSQNAQTAPDVHLLTQNQVCHVTTVYRSMLIFSMLTQIQVSPRHSYSSVADFYISVHYSRLRGAYNLAFTLVLLFIHDYRRIPLWQMWSSRAQATAVHH